MLGAVVGEQYGANAQSISGLKREIILIEPQMGQTEVVASKAVPGAGAGLGTPGRVPAGKHGAAALNQQEHVETCWNPTKPPDVEHLNRRPGNPRLSSACSVLHSLAPLYLAAHVWSLVVWLFGRIPG